ncbi:hypothetical protein FRACYDRAFT_254505 [Fragilariopsis cylindrus CCMP1102]|uniref:Macro domain-containing protein n=1 Tax=Fragilariopsis cylindrus CCMP1102 TaxID=635003 RepID=A0A1E7EKT8_9STRA|nr:hypothetical protein FRACYDRAFT_254505 [Fragilariopsis cylindrus CCMP1102]|eukprot:OEU06485.1 hypothetical protein FRACYDRAFT_254505 [Fragilariopsis cylindrus CCMP1102]
MSTAWYKPNRIPKRIRSWITSSSSTLTSSLPTSSSSLPTSSTLTSSSSISSLPTSSSISSSEIIMTNQKKKNLQQQQQQHHSRSIEVWDTTCNPSLSGVSQFSYFPVGGPEPYIDTNNKDHDNTSKDSHPIMGYVTQWGGMDVGNGMMFASNTIDGLVHQYGGKLLKLECQRVLASMKMKTKMKTKSQQTRINEGTAIQTNVVGQKLIDISGYKKLIHTVPPFFHHHNHKHKNNNDIDNNDDDIDNDGIVNDVDFLLAECYRNSLNLAIRRSSSSSTSSLSSSPNNDNHNNNLRIACPLLGAGCRGFPIDPAPWWWSPWRWFDGRREEEEGTNDDNYEYEQPHSVTIAFGIPDGEIRKKLIEAIDQEMEKEERNILQ